MWCRVIRLPGFDPASSYTIPGALQGHCVKLLKHIGKDHHLRKKILCSENYLSQSRWVKSAGLNRQNRRNIMHKTSSSTRAHNQIHLPFTHILYNLQNCTTQGIHNTICITQTAVQYNAKSVKTTKLNNLEYTAKSVKKKHKTAQPGIHNTICVTHKSV